MDGEHRLRPAVIKLKEGQFRILGPVELVISINNIKSLTNDTGVQHKIYLNIIKNWYVNCSITNDKIPLNELRYWNVDKCEIYKNPEIMPLWDRYEKLCT
jgi:hypothetical protein